MRNLQPLRTKSWSLIALGVWVVFLFSCQVTGAMLANMTFTKITKSTIGFEYLSYVESTRVTRLKCASACLRTAECNAFIFIEPYLLCTLVKEYSGGFRFEVEQGDLYSSIDTSSPCPESNGYKNIDIGNARLKCVKVEDALDKTFVEARASCQSDGAELLHFENTYNYSFSSLTQYFPYVEGQYFESFWVGLNWPIMPNTFVGPLSWDHSQEPLSEDEENAIPWGSTDPVNHGEEKCVYLHDNFQVFVPGNCLFRLGFICVMDV